MKGYGTKFLRSTDDVTYTQIANLLDVEVGESSRGSIENTTLDQADQFKTFEPGMIDAGELSLSLIWDIADAGQVLLKADLENDTLMYYRVEYPDGTTVDYHGFVTGMSAPVAMEDKITQTVKFKVSGKPTVT
ncbi:MAG: hypothetical protein JKY67_22590 [Pseudomonadales bacterium]|nr:hypothetical protein [Pseudomonadales bacterium]